MRSSSVVVRLQSIAVAENGGGGCRRDGWRCRGFVLCPPFPLELPLELPVKLPLKLLLQLLLQLLPQRLLDFLLPKLPLQTFKLQDAKHMVCAQAEHVSASMMSWLTPWSSGE